MIDRRPEKVASHVMDLEQVLAVGGGLAVSAGSWDELDGVDVLVVCASTALTANTSRAVYLQDNSAIVDGIAARLAGWHGVVVMVTNPVDPLTARLARARWGTGGASSATRSTTRCGCGPRSRPRSASRPRR